MTFVGIGISFQWGWGWYDSDHPDGYVVFMFGPLMFMYVENMF